MLIVVKTTGTNSGRVHPESLKSKQLGKTWTGVMCTSLSSTTTKKDSDEERLHPEVALQEEKQQRKLYCIRFLALRVAGVEWYKSWVRAGEEGGTLARTRTGPPIFFSCAAFWNRIV